MSGNAFMQKYLVRFVQVREDFRLEETRAICRTFGIEFPEEDAQRYSSTVLQSTFSFFCIVAVLGRAFRQ